MSQVQATMGITKDSMSDVNGESVNTIKSQTTDLTEFDETLVKRWLKQITVWPDHCTVELKSGVSVDINR
jgi:hypothetical protein